MDGATEDYVELGNQHRARQMSQGVSPLHFLLQTSSYKCHLLFKKLVFTVNGNCYEKIINVHNAEVNMEPNPNENIYITISAPMAQGTLSKRRKKYRIL